MNAGLVKSLVLDKRRELGALPNEELQFKADRDEHGQADFVRRPAHHGAGGPGEVAQAGKGICDD